MQFSIDPEFRDLLPPLTEDERLKLMMSVNADGCREPLVVWKEEAILVDGHNRYAICNDLELPYEVVVKSFKSRDDVKLWICRNQLGRRNLTDFQRAEIALRMKPVVESQAKARGAATVGRPSAAEKSVENLPPIKEPKTRDVVGEIAGVSGKTVDKVEQILEMGSPELIAQARSKEVSIEKAHRIVTGKSQESTAIATRPAIAERQGDGWLAVKEKLFSQVREYCRKTPAARDVVVADLRELLKLIER